MPKTVSIAPSWYWPTGTPRFSGIPPFGVEKMILGRLMRERPAATAVAGDGVGLTSQELWDRSRALAAGIEEADPPAGGAVGLSGEPCGDSVVGLLGALLSSRWVRLVGDGGEVALTVGSMRLSPREVGPKGGAEDRPTSPNPERPALGWDRDPAVHSETSLLAAAISLSLFYRPLTSSPWAVTLPLDHWGWAAFVLAGLYSLVPTTVTSLTRGLPVPQASEPAVVVGELSALGALARDAKREFKSARGRVAGVIATIERAFDSGDRKRLEKLLDCPVLTVLGSYASGPVIASHPSWYVAESAGIPLTNSDIIPVDPRSRQPLQTLWELVEYAQLTVRSPMVAPYRREGEQVLRRFVDLCDMGLAASSDPNGMIYVLPG